MKAIKNYYIIIIMLILIIVRPFAPGFWFGSIVILGAFIAIVDTMNKVIVANNKVMIKRQKSRLAGTVLVMAFIGLVILIFAILNLVLDMDWLNKAAVLDEITLFTVLISLEQEFFLAKINKYIKGEKQNDQ